MVMAIHRALRGHQRRPHICEPDRWLYQISNKSNLRRIKKPTTFGNMLSVDADAADVHAAALSARDGVEHVR
jgi:hypothetical protein